MSSDSLERQPGTQETTAWVKPDSCKLLTLTPKDLTLPSKSVSGKLDRYWTHSINFRRRSVKFSTLKLYKPYATMIALSLTLLVVDDSSLVASITSWRDRKSTRLNSSHSQISYAVFCLK